MVEYRITLNERQLRIVNAALEEYFRLALNQWWDLSDRLCMIDVDFSQDNPRHEKIFDDFITRREAVREVFTAAGRIIWPHGKLSTDEESAVAIDMWRVIRHQLYKDSGSTDTWRVDASPPFIQGGEPAIGIERLGDG